MERAIVVGGVGGMPIITDLRDISPGAVHCPCANERENSSCVPRLLSHCLRNGTRLHSLAFRISSNLSSLLSGRHVKENLTSNSLVLVDELGKGTEPNAGAAIAASFLEDLLASGCRAYFAT